MEGYDIKNVILFSSVARGQAKEHSDIDIIAIASGLLVQEDMPIAKTGFQADSAPGGAQKEL